MSGRVEQGVVQDDAVSLDLENAATVADFLAKRQPLSLEARLTLVDEAVHLLDELYVHLPVKRAMYAVDPVRRLQLLRFRLQRYQEIARDKTRDPPEQDDLWFLREMVDTLTSVRDLHTLYVLPDEFATAVAFVPFQIESYFDQDRKRRYMVTNVIGGLDWLRGDVEQFVPGVEVVQWNDVPMPRAVELAGEQNSGGNPDARLARGLARLTIRPLAKALPPDEEWATVNYLDLNNVERTLRAQWHVVVLNDADSLPMDGARIKGWAEGMDYETDLIRNMTKHLYAAWYPRTDSKWAPIPWNQPAGDKTLENLQRLEVQEFRRAIDATTFNLSGKNYGYLRVRSFKVNDPDELKRFIGEFCRLVELMPEDGLIIDIRDNPGGCVAAGERLLQLLTPRQVQPETAQFIATRGSVRLSDDLGVLYGEWFTSLQQAMETRTSYSLDYPLTSAEDCNNIGQRYYGPVILITNGLCYSTADIFAAGFQDNEIGEVLGTDGSTGAGGADVITHSWLCKLMDELGVKDSPFQKLTAGDLRFAIRRTLRVGNRLGIQLEDLGVTPDPPIYRMTRDDLLHRNIDLIQEAVSRLGKRTCYRLREVAGSMKSTDQAVLVKIETQNLVRLDIAIDGWQSPSIALVADRGESLVEAKLPPGKTGKKLELRGFDKDSQLVALRTVPLDQVPPAQTPP